MTERAAPGVATARRNHGFHPLRVVKVVEETADTRSFVLVPPDDARDLFSYRAGQFCTFRVIVDDEELLRCYSMSSAPETDAELAVTVKRVPNGRVSGWLNDIVAEGDVLEATRPAGVFCVRDNDRPVVAYAGGSGITPVMSITKSVLTTTTRPVRLLYANRDRDGIIFRTQLEQLNGSYGDRLEVRHHLDSESGYLDAAAIRSFLGDDHHADLYLCGPTPFMDLVEQTMLDLGVDPAQILIERFANEGQTVRAGDDRSSGESPSGGASVPDEVTVILKGKRHSIAYRAGDTLLDTARRGGLRAPFSCEAGECATCMAFIKDGAATMRVNNALDDDEIAEGWVLTCQAIPEGRTVTVEYESF
jgi:3-ketosteroid 9alpha-monooxygenase subunit B